MAYKVSVVSLGCPKNQVDAEMMLAALLKDGFELSVEEAEADAIILGSPVYYAGIAGTMKCFLDRAFYTASMTGNAFKNKVGAVVVAARRGGASSTFAGFINGEWNAPPTLKGKARLAPASVSFSQASLTPSMLPEITTCPGQL